MAIKATLAFTLPEDTEAFAYALKGADLSAAVSAFDEWLRSEIKYKERPDAETLQEARDTLWRMINEYGAGDLL